MMHRKLTICLLSLTLLLSVAAHARTPTLASTLQIYVFPTEGQDAAQQSKDETACYERAVDNAGSDPFKVAEQQLANFKKAFSVCLEAKDYLVK